jgi:hypothetical protein
MSRTRTFPGLLLALTLGLVASGFSVAPASAAPHPKIWGVVTDGAGAPVLGVHVEATDEDGDVVASDLSYDDPDGDHAPRPGYFELYVGANGTFTVTFKKKGFVSEKVRGVEVARGSRVVDLGEVALLRTTETSGKLDKAEIRADEKGKVKVTVEPHGMKPTGGIEVREGRKTVGSATLKAKHKGQLTVTLDKLAKGTHELKVVYDGSSVFAGSTSGKLTLTVKPPKKKLQRPNALLFVG